LIPGLDEFECEGQRSPGTKNDIFQTFQQFACSLFGKTDFSIYHHHTTSQPFYSPFFRDHPVEPVPEENFWTLWCKGRLTEVDTPTTRMGATPSGLTSAHLHHPPIFFTDRMPFLPPNQQHQSTES